MSIGVVLARAPNSTVVRYDDIPDGAYTIVADIRAKLGKERTLSGPFSDNHRCPDEFRALVERAQFLGGRG